VTGSGAQRAWIEARRARGGFGGVEVITDDVNELALTQRFDRVVSIEMFEQIRNWELLLARISGWLEPGGKAFVEVSSHRRLAYELEGSWAAERFFAAARMPSHELMLRFQRDLEVQETWAVPGTHYARTLGAWLERLDVNAHKAQELLGDGVGDGAATRALAEWRLFLLSSEQKWGWRGGKEWMVSDYLLGPR
jgi:cyclopropane-fatty-acyl-phospholipid synthase